MKSTILKHWPRLAFIAILMAVTALFAPQLLPGAQGDLTPLLLAMPLAAFPVTPELTAITIAYRNNRLIADEVLPRVPVGVQSFKYTKYPIGSFFTVPETKVGRKGQPNQVEFTGEEVTDSTVDHALDDAVPNADIENARNQQGVPDPQMRATEGLTDLIMLAREKRAADVVFAAGNYAAANKITLAGNDQWSDYANSDPIDDIMTALDSVIMRPNLFVMGNAVASKLRRHPDIVKAYNGTAGDAGIVPLEFVQDLFEIEVKVGQGWLNTAKPGQPVSMARVWGKHAALVYRDKNADTQRGTTFGFTAQWGGRVAGSEFDKNIGMRGGQVVRVGESVKELITANDLGYLITDAVA